MKDKIDKLDNTVILTVFSVSERLPLNNDEVIVQDGHRVFTAYYDSTDREWVSYDGLELGITHWSPLPLKLKKGE